MRVIALTGGIATGKSTVARQAKRLGAALYDADAAVHRLLAKGGHGVAKVKAFFPEAEAGGAIDRKKLGQIVFADKAKLLLLEEILHPLVWQEEAKFLTAARKARARMALLEIPLLFESKAKKKLDGIWVVSAPKFLQRKRALARPGMTEEKLRQILARQVPDHVKRRKADVVIHTGLGHAHSMREVKRAMAKARRTNANGNDASKKPGKTT